MAESNDTYADTVISGKETEASIYLDAVFSSEIFALVINVVCMSIGVVGIVTNILNITVFLRQGLDNSMNISFFCKSVADLVKILSIEWANVAFNSSLEGLVTQLSLSEVYFVLGSWPSGFVCRLSLYIAVYITAERCLCVLFPLKIKTLITPTRTKFIIAVIGIFSAIPLIPEYSSVYLAWEYNKEKNKTVLGVAFRSSRSQTQGVSFLCHVALVMAGLSCILVLTTVLVVLLRRQSQWRTRNTNDISQGAAMSKRDRKSVAMVCVVAVTLVFFYTPLASVSMVTAFITDLYIAGHYTRPFLVLWNTVYIFGMVNCTSNIIIYYQMNSRFKVTLRNLICLEEVKKF